jgi:hypothetical protein
MVYAEAKAAWGCRTPRRWRAIQMLSNRREVFGVRQPHAAFNELRYSPDSSQAFPKSYFLFPIKIQKPFARFFSKKQLLFGPISA